MNSKLMKLAVVMLAAVAILGTAGAVSAHDLSIELSTGEITNVSESYTGYVVFTPSSDFKLNAFKVSLFPNESHVTITSAGTTGLFTGSDVFTISSYTDGTNYSITASLDAQKATYDNVTLASGTAYKLFPFTINVDSKNLTTNLVNLNFTDFGKNGDKFRTYVSSSDRTVGAKGVFHSTNGLDQTPYMLNNSTANSVAVLKPVSVAIETNGTIFDGNVSVFSELTKKIANSSNAYYLNYTSADESVIKFYNYTVAVNATPKFVVLKGSSSAKITVNLTNKSTGKAIDTKTFTVTTTPINITSSFFNYTANHTYTYTGKSVADTVAADVKKALLNHSIGAADSTDNASTYGYVRSIGDITLTFFNDSKCQHQVTPIDGGIYYFNVSIAANGNYNATTNMTIGNNSFTINGATVFGTPVLLNISYFNATTPAKVTIEFNATGMNLNLSVFNITTVVPKYTYWQNSLNLSFKQVRNFTGTATNYTIAKDNSSITFNASTAPTDNVTYFDFIGYPRGDVTLDDQVLANDASVLALYYANQTKFKLTKEQLFYGSISGQNYIELVDIRQIAQYAAGYLDDDYKSV